MKDVDMTEVPEQKTPKVVKTCRVNFSQEVDDFSFYPCDFAGEFGGDQRRAPRSSCARFVFAPRSSVLFTGCSCRGIASPLAGGGLPSWLGPPRKPE